MQEYSITVKTTDVGLAWEVHYKAKRQFEATDLKRIFQFCVQVLSEIIKSDAFNSPSIQNLMKYLLMITENVLTWGYISHIHILFMI